jgi:excisionase family DNA binding protein
MTQTQAAPRHRFGSISSEWMTVEEASSYLSLSKSTIYKKVYNRVIPHYKRDGSLYFKKPEIDKWIEGGKVETKSALEQLLPNLLKP